MGLFSLRFSKGRPTLVFFEDFIEQLLQHCGRWPEPKSVLIMDNASFYHTERVKDLCSVAGVKLVYLPPYSPGLNPIEEFFAELKGFIKRHSWDHASQHFGDFLGWCVNVAGARGKRAKGHFWHAGLDIEELE